MPSFRTCVVLGLTTLAACSPRAARPTRDAEFTVAESLDPEIRDKDITFYEQRLREDPASATDRSRLGMLYISRARERGDYADVQRAESLAVQSLTQREAHNTGTWSLLASARLASHDFVGALDAARHYVESDTTSPAAQALLGEILLEMGRYDEARAIFTSLEGHTDQPSIAARLSRWYEITGRIGQAQSVARYAAKVARRDGGLSREQVAWFSMRVGDLALKRGALAEADTAYAFGLRVFPGDHRILAGQARVAMARGDFKAAIAAGEQAIAVQLDPATLGLLADAWLAAGDTAQSESYARAMTLSALEQPGPIHRAWGLYLVDHGQRLDDVLRRVRVEAKSRRDVYGYDLLAWTLHAKGDDEAAWQAAQVALSQGTEDAQIVSHAAVIARAIGKAEQAAQPMARAVAINPAYRSGAVTRDAAAIYVAGR
jgi:tetratricopeptide (TPR) repeat protein